MNILREIRKTKEKSLSVRIILALMFCAVFIVNTYAWFVLNKEVNLSGLTGEVTSWDVSYYVEDEEILDETATFLINEAYPGMPNREETVNIYNIGKTSTKISYELISVKVFGVEILDELKEKGEITVNGKETHIFSTNQNYPFNISYAYERESLVGQYVDDETTPNSKSEFKFNVSWPYEEGESENDIDIKDLLDTKFGKEAYKYYESGKDPNTAVEVKVKIKSEMADSGLISDDINVIIYGKNGEGIAYLELDKSLVDQGYTIEYQKVAVGETFSEAGTWTKDQQINNLSVGDTIYARLIDGTNTVNNSSIFIHNVNQLETFSEPKTTLTRYTDINGDSAYIPAGFKVGTSDLNNTIESGLVIEHATTGDQFVWVPVKHAIYDPKDGTIPTDATSANKNKDASGRVTSYKPMAKYQNGYSSTTEKQYFEGIAYTSWGANLVKGSYAHRSATDYALGKNSLREPSLVTGSTSQYTWEYKAGTQYDGDASNYSNILKFNSATEFGEYMNTEYTNMILSVKKYGGFYVGRYETSLSGTTVKSQYNTTPMASIDWYNMYYNQDSKRNPNNPYYGNTGFVASMIWGSQHDAVLNWILDEGVYADKVYTVTGNHSGSRRSTGLTGNDFANNVIDLCSNVLEWNQEADAVQYRVYRGGHYNVIYYRPAAYRNNVTSTGTGDFLGSRFTLYIK